MTEQQKPQLFTIHFAGGNCYSFNFLKQHFDPYFEVVALELPGRGKRMTEPLLKDAQDAANALFLELNKHRKQEVLFGVYGHSMGALLGFELIKRLEKENPLFLVVSGNAGPNIGKEELFYNLDQEAFKEELKKLGGIPQEVFDNEELYHFFEPILRADFELVERYETDLNITVNTPIYAVMGDLETNVDSIGNWKKYTTKTCETSILEGNHFFINDQPEAIASLLKKALDETLVY